MRTHRPTVIVLAGALLAAAVLTGCGSADQSTPETTEVPPNRATTTLDGSATDRETLASAPTTLSPSPATESVESTLPAVPSTVTPREEPHDAGDTSGQDYAACGVSLTLKEVEAAVTQGDAPTLRAGHPGDFAAESVAALEVFVSRVSTEYPTASDGGNDVAACFSAVPNSTGDGQLTSQLIIMNRSADATAAGIHRIEWTALGADGEELGVGLIWEGNGCNDGRLLPAMSFTIINCSHNESPTSRVTFTPDMASVVESWNDDTMMARTLVSSYGPGICAEDSAVNGVEVCVVGRGRPSEGDDIAFLSYIINRTEVVRPVSITGFLALYPKDRSQPSQFGVEWAGRCDVPGGAPPLSAQIFSCSLSFGGENRGQARFLPDQPAVFLDAWNSAAAVSSGSWLLGTITDVR